PPADPCKNCFGLLNNHDDLLIWSQDSTTGFIKIFRVTVGALPPPNNQSRVRTFGATRTNLIATINAPNVPVAMNDSGTVAYSAAVANVTSVIFTARGGAGEQFVEFQAPNSLSTTELDLKEVGNGRFAVNNSGLVAFLASPRLLDKIA